MMKLEKVMIILFCVGCLFTGAVSTLFALPQGSSDIDGNTADWLSGSSGGAATCFPDDGVADDNSGPGRVDITEFCLHYDANNLYLLYAWDDTRPQGGDSPAVVVLDMDGDAQSDYVIEQGIDSVNPGNQLVMTGLEIRSCTNTTCSTTAVICSDPGSENDCDGAFSAVGDTWVDPFAGRANPVCNGPNCATQDAFVEMSVPWALLGGTPPDGYLFGLYLSSHSAGTQDGSSDVSGNGIACNEDGCYQSTPSAVSLLSFSSGGQGVGLVWLGVGLLFGGTGVVLLLGYGRRVSGGA